MKDFLFLKLTCIFCIVCCHLNSKAQEVVGTYVSLADGSEFVYQLPPVSRSPQGVILLAHGCHHSATDWFPTSTSCPKCIGLPVETTIVSEALRRGIVPIAVSSENRHHKCWMPHDKQMVSGVLKHFFKSILKEIESPLYLLGASSGGSFVGQFGQAAEEFGIKVAGVCVQISSLYSQRINHKMPPTVFVHMSRDTSTAQDVSSMITHLNANGGHAAEMVCEPKPIVDTYFADHGHALSKENSALLVAALTRAGLLGADGMLLQDPRRSDWRSVATKALPHIVPSKDTLIADESPISELMNMAWAAHEITDEHLQEAFDWLEAQAKSSGHGPAAGQSAVSVAGGQEGGSASAAGGVGKERDRERALRKKRVTRRGDSLLL